MHQDANSIFVTVVQETHRPAMSPQSYTIFLQ